MKTIKLIMLLLACSITLIACEKPKTKEARIDPVVFEKSDECHICGMAVTRFPGPKGEAFDTRNNNAKKFCSTKELLYWYLQPENQHNVKAIFVHDMSQVPWGTPDDTHLISARDAYYVVGSDQKGSMGSTLASFLSAIEAGNFAEKHGGQVVAFNGLTLELLAKNQ